MVIAYIVRAHRGVFTTVYTFAHPLEGDAAALAGEICDRLYDDTGVSHLYQTEPLELVEPGHNERSVWQEAIDAGNEALTRLSTDR